MTMTLALVEGFALFAAVCAPVLFFSPHSFPDWLTTITCLGQALTLTCCYVLAFYYNNLYDLRRVRDIREFGRRLPQSFGVLSLLLTLVYFAGALVGVNTLPLTAGFPSLVFPIVFVLGLRGVLYAAMHSAMFAKRVLILGTGGLAQQIAQEIKTSPHLRYTILGHVGDEGPTLVDSEPEVQCPALGPSELLGKLIEQQQPDVIIMALTERRLRLPVWDLLESRVQGILVEDGIEVYERCTGKLAIERMVPSGLLFSQDFIKSKRLMWVRRGLSCVVAASGLLLTAPLMGLIALAIKWDSEGPIFFVQDRAGLRGQAFPLIKFRTMIPAGLDTTEPVWNRDVSSRITPVGKWLRRFYLDELPQFLNILRGDMDLVGPRPEMATNVKTMAEIIPYFTLRTAVRPGLTGWAQINHGYSVTQEDVTEKMRYDLYYIKHMSLRFDLQIILDTMKNILLRRGT